METTGAEPKPTGPDSSPTMPEPPTIIPDQFAAGFGWVIKNNTVMFQQPNNLCALVYPTARSFNKSDITSLVYRITRIKEVPQTERQFKNRNLQADHKVARQYPLARGVSISPPSVAVQTPLANGYCLATERDLLGDDKNQAVTENNNVLSADELTSAESEKASIVNQQHLQKSLTLRLNGDMRKDEGKKMDRPFNGELNQAVTENNNVLVGALQADAPGVKYASSYAEPSVHSSVSSASLDNQHSKNCHPLHLNGDMQKSDGGKLDACLQCVTQMQHDAKRHLTTQAKPPSQIFGPSNAAETDSGEEKEGAKKQLHPNVTENHQHVKSAKPCFRCDRCNFTTHTKTSLQFHMESHGGEPAPFVATTTDDATAHSRQNEKPCFRCDRCNFKARSARRLDAHLRRQHAEGSVRCTLCSFTALNQRGLNMHVRRTHSNKSEEDPDDLEREKNDDISEHLEKHGKTGLLQCPQCDYLTKWRKNLRQHVRDAHTTSHDLQKTSHNLGYKCPDCGQTFRTVSLLRLHVRRKHTGERPFQCPHCSYAALVSSHLERHILRHTGVRPYMCEDCGYMASTKDVLANHRRTHSGEKPYRCEVCGYAARRRHHLQGHMAKHAPTKPDRTFKCEFCDYAAVRKFHLVRHMSRHYGEKPFKCYMCEYSTVDNSRLQAHIRAHTGEKPFRCEMCEFATARKDHLKQHVIRHALWNDMYQPDGYGLQIPARIAG
ncbi:hypothetical protein Bbelb_008490 [Branchiostoma belcheri]|nr:hypothetical protein Bbelb_008490 [Branchiostoma belcheri]